MREIKFRAKRIDTGKWVYGNYFKSPLTDENSGTRPESGWFFLTGEIRHCIANENGAVFIIDEKTLGQYIERKDKNRTEIYEGDLVKTDYDGWKNPYIVRYGEFEEEFYQWEGENETRRYIGWYLEEIVDPAFHRQVLDTTSLANNAVEVIGTSCENPELLKEVKN